MGFKVLVVEDEESIADFVVRGLREEGFIVESASDGISAWYSIAEGAWDLIILDWWLPGMDGLQLLGRLREKNRSVPVLFLTARDAIADRVKGLNAGANDYLCKPFAFEELLARTRALTRREEQQLTVVAYSDVQIDLLTQRVSRNGAPLELTAREQSLLTFFVRHPEQILSRTRIYEQVWDERYEGLSNTLEMHVMGLRRALEAHGPRLIQTRRGRGYWFGMEAK